MLRHPLSQLSRVYLPIAMAGAAVASLVVPSLTSWADAERAFALANAVVLMTVSIVLFASGRRRRSVVDSMEANDSAQAHASELNALINSLDDLVFTADREGRITRLVGPAVEGMDAESILGRSAVDLFGSDMGHKYSQLHERVLAGERVTWEWFRGSAVDGRWKGQGHDEIAAMLVSMSPLRDPSGQIVGSVGVGQDISRSGVLERERDSAHARLDYLAHYDDLTGLPNRVLVHDRMEQALARAERTGARIGVHFIDLDGFKDVNDSMGHAAGDVLLQAVAKRLRLIVRRADTLARLGGDEFVIIQSDVEDILPDVGVLAERIVDAFTVPFEIEGREFYIRASIGVAFAPDDGNDLSDLFRAADLAMYEAKQQGGGQFEVYSTTMGEAIRRRLRMGNELRSAIGAGRITVEYQPIATMGTNTVVSMEALARWESPTFGPVGADIFIPLAESTGLIHALDDMVRSQALAQLRDWVDAGIDVTLHLNISSLRLALPNFDEALVDAVRASGVSPERVIFEITESTLVADSTPIVDALTRLRSQGFGIAADDFGAGYSMINYLKRLPLTLVKTDRSFLDDLSTERDRTILQRVITLGHDLSYTVVVEGIETEEQRAVAEGCGAEEWQGFLFSRPLAPHAATAFLLTLREQTASARG